MPRASPVRKNTDKERIKELEKQLESERYNTGKMAKDFSEFQDEVGVSIIPFQKLVLYISVLFLFGFGLGLIIYAATHPDMDQAETTRSNMYIVGGACLAFAVVMYFVGKWWLSAVEKSPGLKKINALMFEANLASDVIRGK